MRNPAVLEATVRWVSLPSHTIPPYQPYQGYSTWTGSYAPVLILVGWRKGKGGREDRGILPYHILHVLFDMDMANPLWDFCHRGIAILRDMIISDILGQGSRTDTCIHHQHRMWKRVLEVKNLKSTRNLAHPTDGDTPATKLVWWVNAQGRIEPYADRLNELLLGWRAYDVVLNVPDGSGDMNIHHIQLHIRPVRITSTNHAAWICITWSKSWGM